MNDCLKDKTKILFISAVEAFNTLMSEKAKKFSCFLKSRIGFENALKIPTKT